MIDDHSFIGRLAPFSLTLDEMQTQPAVVAAHRISQGDKPPPRRVWPGLSVEIETRHRW